MDRCKMCGGKLIPIKGSSYLQCENCLNQYDPNQLSNDIVYDDELVNKEIRDAKKFFKRSQDERLIHKNFDEAMSQIDKALDIEPTNSQLLFEKFLISIKSDAENTIDFFNKPPEYFWLKNCYAKDINKYQIDSSLIDWFNNTYLLASIKYDKSGNLRNQIIDCLEKSNPKNIIKDMTSLNSINNMFVSDKQNYVDLCKKYNVYNEEEIKNLNELMRVIEGIERLNLNDSWNFNYIDELSKVSSFSFEQIKTEKKTYNQKIDHLGDKETLTGINTTLEKNIKIINELLNNHSYENPDLEHVLDLLASENHAENGVLEHVRGALNRIEDSIQSVKDSTLKEKIIEEQKTERIARKQESKRKKISFVKTLYVAVVLIGSLGFLLLREPVLNMLENNKIQNLHSQGRTIDILSNRLQYVKITGTDGVGKAEIVYPDDFVGENIERDGFYFNQAAYNNGVDLVYDNEKICSYYYDLDMPNLYNGSLKSGDKIYLKVSESSTIDEEGKKTLFEHNLAVYPTEIEIIIPEFGDYITSASEISSDLIQKTIETQYNKDNEELIAVFYGIPKAGMAVNHKYVIIIVSKTDYQSFSSITIHKYYDPYVGLEGDIQASQKWSADPNHFDEENGTYFDDEYDYERVY